MGPKDVILQTAAISDRTVKAYLADLSDADLLLVPVEGMHPIALQLGHLISTELRLAELVSPGSSPPLPEGFAEKHDIKNPPADASGFLSKDAYLAIWEPLRANVNSMLASIPDSELGDTRDGKLPSFAPTVGAVFNLIGAHWLLHAGQFVAVRRYLKKPIAF